MFLGEIRDEDLYGMDEQFPHLYAALNLDVVTAILEFPA
jgi:uncharacterized protein (DUF952 family)